MEDIKGQPSNKIEQLTATIANGLIIDTQIKLGVLLQIISNEPFNILIVGDPSSGKSKLLKSVAKLAPESDYISGNIYPRILSMMELSIQQTAVKKTKLLLMDDLASIDTKNHSSENYDLLIELMDKGTSVLAAAKPKFGRFDPYGILAEQIDLPANLVNRFDLIFVMKDVPDRKKDKEMISALCNGTGYKAPLSAERFSNHTISCKKFNPSLTNEAKTEIERYYVEMRNPKDNELHVIPISLRQAEDIIKMAKAHAMLNHSDNISEKDVKIAIGIINWCLKGIGFDSESGEIDIDRIASGISAAQRKRIRIIQEIMKSLENKFGKAIPIEGIVTEAGKQNITEDLAEELIEILKRKGQVYIPKEGFISQI